VQTKTQSLIEACLNTATGFALSVVVQVLVFPLYGVHLSLGTNMQLVAIFTAVSILRSYWWRRFFNNRNAKPL
jgi:membrane protein implicated in regulation of membrane protease activity